MRSADPGPSDEAAEDAPLAGLLARLREAESSRQAILDSLLDPHVLIEVVRDGSGTIVDFRYLEANRAACDYFGLSDVELVGARTSELAPRHSGCQLIPLVAQSVTSGEPLVLDDYPYPDPHPPALGPRLDLRGVPAGDRMTLTWRDLTDRHQAARALAASEARFRILAENSSDIVYSVDGQSRITWISPSVREVLGWDPEHLVGTCVRDLMHPQDVLAIGAIRDSAKDLPGQMGRARIRFATAAGDWRWMSVAGRLVLDEHGGTIAAVESVRDVHDEVCAEQALEASEARFRLLAENSSDIVYSMDAEGRFQWISPSVKTLLGWDAESLLGTLARDLLHPDDRAKLTVERTRMLAGSDAFATVVRARRAVGDHIWLSLRAHVMRDPANAPSVIVGARDVNAEVLANDQLAFQAFHDDLTGLRNRAWILDMLEVDLLSARRSGNLVGVLFIDLDNFKVVNDSLGHAAGDKVLARVAKKLAKSLRPGDHVGRFGGDEFIVVVPEARDAQHLERVAERIAHAISQEVTVMGHRIVPSASIGIAVSRADSTPTSLLRDTDAALFRAKAAGRSRWHFFDEAMHAQAISRLTTEDELRRGIRGHQFVVHLQPIVKLADGEVVGHEALVRWQHPTRGLLHPGDFLAVAEDSGLIAAIGGQVLDQVCQMLASSPGLLGTMSVNVSAVQLARAEWLAELHRTVARWGVDPGRLVVEVTETSVLAVSDSTRADLHRLRDLGFGLHVDDFGTGFSSISLLRDLPVTGLKLDSTFVGDLGSPSSPANALATGILGLVSGLHLVGIAEGIETAEQARILREQGWTHGQGYYFGRPAAHPSPHAVAALPGPRVGL